MNDALVLCRQDPEKSTLSHCPDSWENMGKKVDKENTEKSQSHGDL